MNKCNMFGKNKKTAQYEFESREESRISGNRFDKLVSPVLLFRQRVHAILAQIDSKIVGQYSRFIPAAVFAGSMAVVGSVWKTQVEYETKLVAVQHQQELLKIKIGIENEVSKFSQLLFDVRAEFSRNRFVSTEEFNDYLNSIKFEQRFPQIQALSFLKKDVADNYQILADAYGFALNEVNSTDEGMKVIAPIVLTSTQKATDTGDMGNGKILGFDNYSESVRKKALEESIESNDAVLTAPIELMQSSKERANMLAYILYLPVFSDGDISTVESRRKKVIGWVSASFYVDTIVNGALSQTKVNGPIALFDESLDGGPVYSNYPINFYNLDGIENGRNPNEITIKIAGRNLTAFFEESGSMVGIGLEKTSRSVLYHGTQASLIFGFLVWMLIRSRSRVLQVLNNVSESKQELESAKKQYMTLFRESGVAMMLIDPDTGEIVDANNQACDFYGFTHSNFHEFPVSQFAGTDESVVQAFLAAHIDGSGKREFRHKMLDGTIRDVHLTSTFIEHNGKKHVLAVIQDLTERNRAIQDKDHLLNHDALTNLPNRRLLTDRLKMAIAMAKRNRTNVGILFLDLDNFKTVNDTQGHAIGDLLLKEVAKRMQSTVRGCDTIARQGGDEFIVLLPGIHSNEDLAAVAGKLISEIERAFHIEGHELFVGASIGGSVYPTDSSRSDDLLQFADLAMYQAKTAGKSLFRHYQPEYSTIARENQELIVELHHAIDKGELSVVYQPIIDAKTGKIHELEALARWNSKKFGNVPPSKFIPLAEDSGLIVEIGEWIMKSACNEIKTLHLQGYPQVRCAVNLSARQFRSKDLVHCIRSAIEESGISPEWLTIELTESFLVRDVETVARVLNEISDIGVQISIDDFGTGYSSLAYLRSFPIDVLKIDRLFVSDLTTDMDALEVMRGIISLAHGLRMKVVVEGIDDPRHRDILAEMNCDYLQGFGISHPISPSDPSFLEFMNKN